MKIEMIKIDDLKHYALNAKKHPKSQIEGIAESIKRFGFVQPIVIDDKNEIIIGHGRHLASLHLKMKEVPTVKISNLTDAQIRSLRLIDNRISETGWDETLLIEDLATLDADFSTFNINFDFVRPLYDLPNLDDDREETEETNKKEENDLIVLCFQKNEKKFFEKCFDQTDFDTHEEFVLSFLNYKES